MPMSESREEFHESQPEGASDSRLWSQSFLLLMQRNFNGWGTKGGSDSLLRLGCTVSGQRRDSPTLIQLKCVLLCLRSDWGKQSEEK